MVLDMTRKMVSKALGFGFAATALLFAGTVNAQSVSVAAASGGVGSTVALEVSFTAAEDFATTGLAVRLGFDSANPINLADTKPACIVNPDIMKDSTDFNFLPNGCTHGTDCVQVLAGVVSFVPANNALEIPSGPVFTCTFTIPEGATEGDTFQFNVDSAIANDVDGLERDVTEASTGGTVTVVLATATPTSTDTPEPTATPTNTPQATATNTPGAGGGEDDDGCQMVAPADAHAGWLLLVPAAVLIWRRRRAR
jgi:hypothetical protein